jgi:hypothetical protein
MKKFDPSSSDENHFEVEWLFGPGKTAHEKFIVTTFCLRSQSADSELEAARPLEQVSCRSVPDENCDSADCDSITSARILASRLCEVEK